MKKIKSLNRWAICQLNKREVAEYGFQYAVIHPDNVEYLGTGVLTPADTDIECETIEQAISWIENYDRIELEIDDAFIEEVEKELAKAESNTAYKTMRTDKETGAKVSVIYQDNGWICEVWEYPDGTRDEIFHK